MPTGAIPSVVRHLLCAMIHHQAFYQHGVTSPLLVQAQNLYFCGSHNIGCTSLLYILEGYCSLIVLLSECKLGTRKIRLRLLSIQEDTQSYQKLPEVLPSHE